MCAWRGVEDRERAWFFALVIHNLWAINLPSEIETPPTTGLYAKRASDLPSKIFTPGKFYVPDRYTPEGGQKLHRRSASD